jgi:hypothetical protein
LLAELMAGQPIQCDILGKDKDGRALGVCIAADIELNKKADPAVSMLASLRPNHGARSRKNSDMMTSLQAKRATTKTMSLRFFTCSIIC